MQQAYNNIIAYQQLNQFYSNLLGNQMVRYPKNVRNQYTYNNHNNLNSNMNMNMNNGKKMSLDDLKALFNPYDIRYLDFLSNIHPYKQQQKLLVYPYGYIPPVKTFVKVKPYKPKQYTSDLNDQVVCRICSETYTILEMKTHTKLCRMYIKDSEDYWRSYATGKARVKYCKHDKLKTFCSECGGTSLCIHLKQIAHCRI